MLRGADEHGAKKRSFAFTLAYIKCFRTYSLYLSLRLPAQIPYAGIHLPPQREARALPRRALKWTASERKIVTKETHQGCLSFLFKSPLLAKARRGRSRSAHRIYLGSLLIISTISVRRFPEPKEPHIPHSPFVGTYPPAERFSASSHARRGL